MPSYYASFSEVEKDVKVAQLKTEAELRQAIVEALKSELNKRCPSQHLVEFALRPMIDRSVKERRKPDVGFSNVVIEVEFPRGGLSKGRAQLEQYMRDLASKAKDVVVHGVVTDGVDAEYYELRGEHLEVKTHGKLSEVMAYLLDNFFAQKIPVVAPEDLVDILGV